MADALVVGQGSGVQGTRHRHHRPQEAPPQRDRGRAPYHRGHRSRQHARRAVHHRVVSDMNRDEIMRTVERCIVEIAGDEVLIAAPLRMTTTFNTDLELESIEFVALAEKLQLHYGIDFVGWISNKELDQIIALTVGELIDYIVSCRS